MSSHTYSALDVTVDLFLIIPGSLIRYSDPAPPGYVEASLSTFINHIGPGHFTFIVSIANAGTGISNFHSFVQLAIPSTDAVYADFSLDFTNLPTDALIKKVTLRYPRSINITLGANKTGGTYTCVVTGFTPHTNGPITGTSAVVVESFAGSDADEILFDYGGVDADRWTLTELITNLAIIQPSYPETVQISTDNPALSLSQSTSDMLGNFERGDGWTLTVEYDQVFHFDFTVSQDTAPVEEDSVVTVTSDPDSLDPPPLDMEQIETIDIVFPDPDNPGSFITIPVLVFTAVSPTLLTFVIPDFGAYQPPYFTTVITSTQFSGSQELQKLWTIWFTSASGLYQLNLDKTNDTLYLEDDLPNTIDVKFYPNPKLKTGFIRG
jgi:hypothetical protein